jgi:protein-S-isoprenylcysteine O-methyltransferase Ste14
MIINHIILAILWILYCILHSLFASLWFKNKLALKMGRHYRHFRLLYTLFALLAMVAIFYFQLIVINSFRLYKPNILTWITGSILATGGLILMSVCIGKYFVNLSGIKSLVKENVSSQLIVTGVHRYVRHPLYLGTFVFIWGLFILQPYLSLLVANTVITLYTLYAIRLEEDKLIEEFGRSYRDYQASVPPILPFFKSHRKI